MVGSRARRLGRVSRNTCGVCKSSSWMFACQLRWDKWELKQVSREMREEPPHPQGPLQHAGGKVHLPWFSLSSLKLCCLSSSIAAQVPGKNLGIVTASFPIPSSPLFHFPPPPEITFFSEPPTSYGLLEHLMKTWHGKEPEVGKSIYHSSYPKPLASAYAPRQRPDTRRILEQSRKQWLLRSLDAPA